MLAAGLAAEDPGMTAAFQSIYLIRLDADEWGWTDLPGFGNVQAVPVFYRLDAEGAPSGDKIDGGAWGADTYTNIAATMGPWFQQQP